MQAMTYIQKISVDGTGGSLGNSAYTKTSTTGGVDLGLAYQPAFSHDLTLGLVGKDLNSPEFTFVDGTKVTVDPMVRAGLAYNIFQSLEIAGDVDITKNKTLVSNLDSQMVGGGLNFHPASWFSLRAGAMENLDSNDKAGLI